MASITKSRFQNERLIFWSVDIYIFVEALVVDIDSPRLHRNRSKNEYKLITLSVPSYIFLLPICTLLNGVWSQQLNDSLVIIFTDIYFLLFSIFIYMWAVRANTWMSWMNSKHYQIVWSVMDSQCFPHKQSKAAAIKVEDFCCLLFSNFGSGESAKLQTEDHRTYLPIPFRLLRFW